MPLQTDQLDVVLLDPNQTGTREVVNEAITSLAASLAKQLSVDLAVESTPYTLPYEAAEGGNKANLQVVGYKFIGALAGAFEVVHPDVEHFFFILNSSDQEVTVKTALGTGVAVPVDSRKFCYCDGVNVDEIEIIPPIASASEIRSAAAGKVISPDGIKDAAAPVTVAYAANVALDLNTFINAEITLTGNITLDNPTNVQPGKTWTLLLIQDATGSRTATWGANFKFPGGTDAVLSTAASAKDLFMLYARSATEIIVTQALDVK